jgi:hypothetical protein
LIPLNGKPRAADQRSSNAGGRIDLGADQSRSLHGSGELDEIHIQAMALVNARILGDEKTQESKTERRIADFNLARLLPGGSERSSLLLKKQPRRTANCG